MAMLIDYLEELINLPRISDEGIWYLTSDRILV